MCFIGGIQTLILPSRRAPELSFWPTELWKLRNHHTGLGFHHPPPQVPITKCPPQFAESRNRNLVLCLSWRVVSCPVLHRILSPESGPFWRNLWHIDTKGRKTKTGQITHLLHKCVFSARAETWVRTCVKKKSKTQLRKMYSLCIDHSASKTVHSSSLALRGFFSCFFSLLTCFILKIFFFLFLRHATKWQHNCYSFHAPFSRLQ